VEGYQNRKSSAKRKLFTTDPGLCFRQIKKTGSTTFVNSAAILFFVISKCTLGLLGLMNVQPDYCRRSGQIMCEILASEEAAARYENQIIELLGTGEYPAKEILRRLQLDWTETKLRDFLKSHKDVEILEKRPLRYTLKNRVAKQKSLFE